MSTARAVTASRLIAGLDYPGSGALSEKNAPASPSADPQAQTPRPPPRTRAPGRGGVHGRVPDRDRVRDPATRPVPAAEPAGEHLRLRLERVHRPLDSPRLAGPRPRARLGTLPL